MVLGDWTNVGGARVARSLSYKLNNVEVARIFIPTVTELRLCQQMPLRTAPCKPPPRPATATLLSNGCCAFVLTRLTDSDNIIAHDGAGLKLVALAPNDHSTFKAALPTT
jgi:hypothetical protein